MQAPEQSPCVAFFRRIGEAINTSETPFIFQRTFNHCVDVIQQWGDHFNLERVFPEQSQTTQSIDFWSDPVVIET